MKAYIVTRTRFGGPPSEFRFATGLASLGDLDAPSRLEAAMGGPAAFEKYLAKARALIISPEANLYRHAADLTYMPQTAV
jgi:hypothetical protein